MTDYLCSCGNPIHYKKGTCKDCLELKNQRRVKKMINRQIAKTQNTIEYGVSQVKKFADGKMWCSAHEGCFRCSFGISETPLHRDAKYERWKYHKELGRKVYCELRLKAPYGRPDLVVVDNGLIFIEEIVVSEREASIILKKKKYPWPISVINAKRKPTTKEDIIKIAAEIGTNVGYLEEEIKLNPLTYKLFELLKVKNDK